MHCPSNYYCFNTKLIITKNNMKTNMGSADRIIRLIVAAIFATLFFTDTVTGTLGTILVVLGAVFALTSFVSFCPLYAIFGINTCSVKKS